MLLGIDHIVWGVPDLQEGIAYFEKISGVKPAIGGTHHSRGTINALVPLGDRRYLELLAPDPRYKGARWMGVGDVKEPMLLRWALAVSDIWQSKVFLEEAGFPVGTVESGSRELPDGRMIRWSMTDPDAANDIGVPFLVEWGETHAVDGMTPICKLMQLEVCSRGGFEDILAQVAHLKMLCEQTALQLHLSTPYGGIVLSS